MAVEKDGHTRVDFPPDGKPCGLDEGGDGTKRVSERGRFQIEELWNSLLSFGDGGPGESAGTFTDDERFRIVFVERMCRVSRGDSNDDIDNFSICQGGSDIRIQERLWIDDRRRLLLPPWKEGVSVEIERPDPIDRLANIPYKGMISLLRWRDGGERLQLEVLDTGSFPEDVSAPIKRWLVGGRRRKSLASTQFRKSILRCTAVLLVDVGKDGIG